MKRIYLHIIHTCLAVALLAGCKSEYPHIEYEGDLGKVEFENLEFRVPIQVAINDPLFDSYTRGMGAFDNVKDPVSTDENWKNADIYVYAFYSPDGMAGTPSGINYGERMDSDNDEKIYCLVDDANNANIGHGKKARLNRDFGSFLQWTKEDQQGDDNMVYYNSTYPQYRYKFFAYYLDNAADFSLAPERRADYVAYDVEIDGTQDLMAGYASPTSAQLEKLTSTGNKHILNNWKKLAYSAETGNIDLFPIFDMHHQLTYMKFFLKADSIVDVNGMKVLDPEVKNVRVENIKITSPYRGKFVVAADDVNRLGVTFSSEEKVLYAPVKVKTDADGNIVTDEHGRRITVSRSEEGKVMPGDSYGFNPRLTPTEEEVEVGVGYLLPAADKYIVDLVCKQVKENGESVYQTSQYELILPGGAPFEPGHKYEVTIKVYGVRDIVLGLDDVIWRVGDDIVVGEEDD